MTDTIHHLPVLAEFLARRVLTAADRHAVDATLGEGGHSDFFLRTWPDLTVHGFDRDRGILETAKARLAVHGARFAPTRTDFADAAGTAAVYADLRGRLDFALFDLGISMWHYRASGRGFTFSADEPLDMRSDASQGPTAADLIREASEEELRRIFRDYGEEERARPLAARLVSLRKTERVTSSARLAAVIAEVIPRTGPRHPATKAFQALRIAVNGELDRIVPGLTRAAEALAPGGRLAVLTYHSLEDRITKDFMKERIGPKIHVNRYRETAPVAPWRAPFKGAVTAGPEETAANPAARSAKLRVLERTAL